VRSPRALFIAILATAALLAAVQPALAGKNVRVRTGDAAPGGRASWIESRVAGHFKLTACDVQKDGYGVVAYASFHRWGFQNRVADLNGANGRCAHRSVSIQLGNFNRPVYVTVCLFRGTQSFCRYGKGRS